ncbi:MAG: NADH-quinone oxidoreductase subunit NuoG [Gammaproteobacteria bacterium]|nr:NADH-quinone oxidoreductase subunit NuoG [Gammaproteobacteria bacterium]
MVNIEINGNALEVPEGTMLLEAADGAGITIPRFCYHSKLSLSASCRMCLVDVEKMPKPLPACATPVGEGMVVHTRSPKAIAAQRAVMEFLLINHPLDCPICDQGGECELQDVAVGYGNDTSEYVEEKRVVTDPSLGSLISTDMTRCIQCTRCVRFGQEIAGQMELGAPGRGEHMHISTYLRGSVSSELSGNVIDLCPVGALTSKPFRFHARSWELSHHDSISLHDGLGSNLRVDVRRDEVMRVVPNENESINECWISDRDRFSYRALQHTERLTQPQIKRDGEWQTVGWDDALTFAAESLQKIVKEHGAEQLGALAGGESTNEEYYLLQKFMRGVGSSNIDYRLKQAELSDSASDPSFPSIGQSITDLEKSDAVLLVGSDLRAEIPLLAQRLRKAVRHGAKVSSIAAIDVSLNMKRHASVVAAPNQIANSLASVANALTALGATAPSECAAAIGSAQSSTESEAIAKALKEGTNSTVMVGAMAYASNDFSQIRQLAAAVAQMSDSRLALLDPAGNAAGASLAGALPHRGVAGTTIDKPGMDWRAMMASNLKGLIVLNSEPELDAADSAATLQGLANSGFVVALSAFDSEQMRQSADVMLPIATNFESAGSAVNLEGSWQRFNAAVNPPGEARPAWKILRVMGNLFDLTGFEQLSVDDVYAELQAECENREYRPLSFATVESTSTASTLQRIVAPSLYHVSATVRRSDALQATESANEAHNLRINSATASRLGIADEGEVTLTEGDFSKNMAMKLDDSIADDCFVLAAGTSESVGFGVDGNFEIGGV